MKTYPRTVRPCSLFGQLLSGFALAMLLGLPGSTARAEEEQAPTGPLTLTECLALGQERQPALAAARASLASAESGQAGLYSMGFLARFSKELRVRKQQACVGVDIAVAGLQQTEWETRYAITRNYYSIIYAGNQAALLKNVVGSLKDAQDNVRDLMKADTKSKFTQLDIDTIEVYRATYEAKLVEASVGVEKATAALREAIGLDRHSPLKIAKDKLPALVDKMDRDQLIEMGLARRGELTQAHLAEELTALEISAQATKRKKTMRTFAAGADIHSRPIPQGSDGVEYRPGAIGLDVPAMLAGKKGNRVDRAMDINARAVAVVDKTQNLIVLDVDAAYLKWKEAAAKVKILEKALKLAKKVADTTTTRFNDKAATAEELVRAQTLNDQTQAQYNEALYMHALSLAGLERATAGGYSHGKAGR